MANLSISSLRELDARILCLGSNRGIVQSILDFDYLAGKSRPSVVGLIATGRKSERYFFGPTEVAVPAYASIEFLPPALQASVNLVLNLTSGRRVITSTKDALDKLPALLGGVIFAEGVPEKHAIELYAAVQARGKWMIGGSSVGLIIPGVLKLGAIGGVQISQLEQSRLMSPGSVAVISSSGGMVNEIIRTVAISDHALSFSVALGGERFPICTPEEAMLAAEDDPATEAICYFGELGGTDEYVVAELIQNGRLTKPVLAYIAGAVSDLFDEPPQFGHAKALAASADESAGAKAAALSAVGVQAAGTYDEFVRLIQEMPGVVPRGPELSKHDPLLRRPALIASTVSGDRGDDVELLGRPLLERVEKSSFAGLALSMLLGRPVASPDLEAFTDFTLRLLVDHGPYVSGAVNTIVAARAGKDLVSSLTSGLLTIGPRFGGAINQSAATWLQGVTSGAAPVDLVENMASSRKYIPGIGHRKYRVDLPDPRVQRLLGFTGGLSNKTYTSYALQVEAITSRKKGNLILNVDGAIAAVLLDLLSESEGYSESQLQALVDVEFFNALFVLSRSVGFMAHYFDQMRLDEGIFRLTPDHVAYLNQDEPPTA